MQDLRQHLTICNPPHEGNFRVQSNRIVHGNITICWLEGSGLAPQLLWSQYAQVHLPAEKGQLVVVVSCVVIEGHSGNVHEKN